MTLAHSCCQASRNAPYCSGATSLNSVTRSSCSAGKACSAGASAGNNNCSPTCARSCGCAGNWAIRRADPVRRGKLDGPWVSALAQT
ncbi:hypothetical protein D9M73_262950 [compost metagenome]